MNTLLYKTKDIIVPDYLCPGYRGPKAQSLLQSQPNSLNKRMKPIFVILPYTTLYLGLATISKHNQFLSHNTEDETIWIRKEKLELHRLCCESIHLILCPNISRNFVIHHFSTSFVNTSKNPSAGRTVRYLWGVTSTLMVDALYNHQQ